MVSSKIFRSRWSAVIWAGGILWTAYDVASAAPHNAPAPANASATAKSSAASDQQTDATGSSYDANDLAILANMAGN
jgi:hypothetical protein